MIKGIGDGLENSLPCYYSYIINVTIILAEKVQVT
jgi:hypothetical protein